MLVAYKKNEQEYVAQKYVYEINKEIEQMAYMTFQYYKEKSVLLNDVFDDMVWFHVSFTLFIKYSCPFILDKFSNLFKHKKFVIPFAITISIGISNCFDNF